MVLSGASSSPKAFSGLASLPRTISSIGISVGGLALFLIFGSWLLISSPFGFNVQLYFLRNSASVIDPIIKSNNLSALPLTNISAIIDPAPLVPSSHQISGPKEILQSNFHDNVTNVKTAISDDQTSANLPYILPPQLHRNYSKLNSTPLVPSSHQISGPKEILQSNFHDNVTNIKTATSDDQTPANLQTILPPQLHRNYSKLNSSSCDLYHGKWFYDTSGPLYTNNTCPILTQMQNCQGNGRPDKDYENWRWKPSQCVLPRFEPRKFLELMRGKTLAFIGDSVARNQMESMLCILWQVEVPRNRGNKRMQRWYFKSTSVMIVRVWSSWLVHQSSEPFDFAPAGVVKLHLDAPDEGFMDLLPGFDVVVLSSGHWFAKQSVYILNNEIVGGQLWWPDNSRPKKIDNIEAFGISVETILTAMGTHPNYTGLTIVRSFSPDHYEGGAWNTGGSCTGKSKPSMEGELVENLFTNIMHEKQVTGFNRAAKKVKNHSKARLMDITEVFSYRHDGHPGPYRNADPNKITKRGPNGEPPPQDCLHWCMPGPVDTWNEMVLEIIRREFEDLGSSTF